MTRIPPLRLLLTALLTATCCMTGVFASSDAESSKSLWIDAPRTIASGGDDVLRIGYDSSVVPYQAGAIRSFTTQADEVYYRVFSGNSTAGAFLSKTKPRSADWAAEAFALPPGNRADFIQEVLVPAGTRLQRSRAAPNIWGRGGAEQFEILKLRPNEFQPVQFGPGVPFRQP